ncbi:SH3 domain-containing protein [Falsiroseomonas sp.]|uniref:SH3 domain-containing protein n=1 Tax=Falsiroseomonas sp. TaxID=2870721 RepID=UPI00273471CE|nr:SH3 domain-containing protein [Falsiroseomonas sp.]
MAALAAGSAAAVIWGWERRDQRGAAAGPMLEAGPRGVSGHTLDQEEVAVAAVRAHLGDANVDGELSDVRLYPLNVKDEIVVCALLPMPRAEAMRVVARVVLHQPTATARATAAQGGQASVQTRTAMVIMEAGPGLGWGGSQQGAALRYCRDPQVAIAASADPLQVPALVQADAEAAIAPAARVVVTATVRVRTAPSGDAAILSTAPRGRSYVVLGRAPGGWIHLGEGQASLGWAHSSLFSPSP